MSPDLSVSEPQLGIGSLNTTNTESDSECNDLGREVPSLRCLSLREDTVVLNSLGGGQFLVRVTVDGHHMNILYDTGASLCFVRPGLHLISTAECAQSESYRHLAEGGLQIRLGDDSSVTTDACLHLKFSVGEKSHDWDYHVMTLPRGVDIIMGMDFMEPNDVNLLCGKKKVMFGTDVLNVLCALNLTDLYGPVNSQELPAEQAKAETPGVQSRNECADVPSRTTNLFLLHHGADAFDTDLCYDGAMFDKLASMHASIDDPVEYFQAYCKLRASDASLSDEMRIQLLDELASSRTEHPQSSKRSQPDSDAGSKSGTETEGNCSFLCVSKRVHESTLNAIRTAKDLSDCFHMDSAKPNDASARSDAAADRLRQKMCERLQERYEEFSRAWAERSVVEPTEENVEKWLAEYYPKDENGISIAGQIDVTIPGHEGWVESLKTGAVCKLAGRAFDNQDSFNPPKWAESLRLYLDTAKGMAKCGPRIRCPVHLREELKKFHETLYSKGFIEPATDCDSYASVLIIRKPDDASGKPRGYRFVVDLRARNNTIVNIANQLPEAAMIFELLRTAKVINVFDVKNGYWNCPLFFDEKDPGCAQNNSRRLTAFQSECGEWQWKCLPQGLSSAGSYFSAWLTRIYRKYDIVMNQTRFIPKDAEEQHLAAMQNMIEIAEHIQSLPIPTVNEHNSTESSVVHDPRKIDELYVLAQSDHDDADGLDQRRRSPDSLVPDRRAELRSKLKRANKRIRDVLESDPICSENSVEVHGGADPSVLQSSVSTLSFVDGKIRVNTAEISAADAVSLCSIGDCAQPQADVREKPILLHEGDSGPVLYADAPSLALMNACYPVTGSVHTWAAEILASSSEICLRGQYSDLMKGGLSDEKLQSTDRDSLLPGDLGVWQGESFLSLYLDDGITRSLKGVEEAKLHALIFARISAVERIPLNQKVKLLCKYVRFLGMINGNGLVIPCPEKVKSIVFLTRPTDVKSLQSFLGSVNWFRRHIASHAEIQAPLNALTKKDVEWNWTEECERAWLTLKRALMTFPVLHIFDPTLPTVLYTDSSGLHVGGALCQRKGEGLVAIAYHSRSLRGPELSYPIQHKECLAIVSSVEAFSHYLLAAHFTVRTCSDHKSLSSCFHGMSKIACDRVTRWVQKLCMYNMQVEYMPGLDMDLPDLLSRCLTAPENAWKSADVIDAADFEYNPLLSIVPEYPSMLYMHYGESLQSDGPTSDPTEQLFSVCDIDYDESLDEPAQLWRPHERALMSMSVLPTTESVFTECDYLVCPDYSAIYQHCLLQDFSIKNPLTKEQVDKKAIEARTLVEKRYEKFKLGIPNEPTKKQAKNGSDVVVCSRHFITGGLLYTNHPVRGPLLCVPDVYDESGVHHRKRIFDECHSVEHRGHRGIAATRAAMQDRFFWPKMASRDIPDMVHACVTCNNCKIQRQKPQGLMNPVETPTNIGQMYNIDFIGPLPKSSLGSDMMMICVDRFSRRVFLYACSKHATSEDIGDLFVTEMCMREGRGIPRVIISDNDKLFTANFWRQLFRRMGTKLKFTHGARSQHSNGLAERMVAVVEEILRTRVNYRQDDWESLIPEILFVLNSQEKKALLGKCSMEVDIGIRPVTPMDLVSTITAAKANQKNTSDEQLGTDKASGNISAAESRLLEMAAKREEIALWNLEIQADQVKYHDARCRLTDKLIKVGAKAYVSMPHSMMLSQGLRPSSKLAHQHFGPFKIVRRSGVNAFELDLGAAVSKSAIPVFHVKYLTAAPEGPYVSGTEALLPSPVSGEGAEEEWELLRIVDRRQRYKKFEYLVEYKGYPLAVDYEWRPEAELQSTAPRLLKDFINLYESRKTA